MGPIRAVGGQSRQISNVSQWRFYAVGTVGHQIGIFGGFLAFLSFFCSLVPKCVRVCRA